MVCGPCLWCSIEYGPTFYQPRSSPGTSKYQTYRGRPWDYSGTTAELHKGHLMTTFGPPKNHFRTIPGPFYDHLSTTPYLPRYTKIPPLDHPKTIPSPCYALNYSLKYMKKYKYKTTILASDITTLITTEIKTGKNKINFCFWISK